MKPLFEALGVDYEHWKALTKTALRLDIRRIALLELPVGWRLRAWDDTGQIRVFTHRARRGVRAALLGLLPPLLLLSLTLEPRLLPFALLQRWSGSIRHA